MESEFYYRIVTDPDNNFADHAHHLTVNCTGHSFFEGDVRANATRRDYYLLYLCSGRVALHRPRAARPLESGELVVFEADEPFQYVKVTDEAMEYYWVHFTGAGARALLQDCGIPTGVPLAVGARPQLYADFQALFQAFLQRDRFFALETANRLTRILLDVGRCLTDRAPAKNHVAVQRAIAYIQNHIAEPLSVEALAAREHLSVSRFRVLFRQAVGVSPQTYLIHTKLNYACARIRQSEESIKQVSLSVGYDDPLYFSRLFKKYIGVSPEAYRRRPLAGGRH